MSDQDEQARRTIRVPGETPARRRREDGERDPEDLLVAPADLGSASRSCLAILIILLIIALLLCVFLVVQPMVN